jgi:exodeoxyribonuclease-3
MLKKMMISIASWNVNGIRSVFQKTFLDWQAEFAPDIICLQEIKATQSQIPVEITRDYPYFTVESAKKKGYSGVMTLSKDKPIKVFKTGIEEFDNEGRTIVSIFKYFIVVNCYFPNGQRDLKRVPYKLEYSKLIHRMINDLTREYQLPVYICGDFNTAHTEIDLANPKSNQKSTGFLPIERAWMDEFTGDGWVDCFRHLNGKIAGQYSWWTYRNNCRARNIGWRIDYFFTKGVGSNYLKKMVYQDQVLGSDHCPLLLTLSL